MRCFPTQHRCSLWRTVLVCPMCSSKRGLAELRIIYATCDENFKNKTITNEYTATEEMTTSEVYRPALKVLKTLPVIDIAIQFAPFNSKNTSTVATICTPSLRDIFNENNVSADGAVFNATSSGITLSSFRTSDVLFS